MEPIPTDVQTLASEQSKKQPRDQTQSVLDSAAVTTEQTKPPHSQLMILVVVFGLLLLAFGAIAARFYFYSDQLNQVETATSRPSAILEQPSPESSPANSDDRWRVFTDSKYPISFTYPTNSDELSSASGGAFTLSYPAEAPPDNNLFLVIGFGGLGEKSLQAFATEVFRSAQNNKDTIIEPLSEIEVKDRLAHTYTTKEARAPEEVRRYVFFSSPDSAYIVTYMEQMQGSDVAEFKQISDRILESFAFPQ
jgi:hypothetical protein